MMHVYSFMIAMSKKAFICGLELGQSDICRLTLDLLTDAHDLIDFMQQCVILTLSHLCTAVIIHAEGKKAGVLHGSSGCYTLCI